MYWAQFGCFGLGITFPGGEAVYRDDLVVRSIERVAFTHGAVIPTAEFWLSRGRLLRAIGDLDPARQSLERSLNIDPSLDRARFELALVHRSQGEAEVAIRTFASDGQAARRGSDNEALLQLLHLETKGEAPDSERRVALLVQLSLWNEAFPQLLSIFGRQPLPAAGYLFLYRTYLGMNRTSEALAAALKHNAGMAGDKIPQVDIDNLRWLHRLDGVAAELQGELCMLVDIGNQQAISDFLCRNDIVPASADAPLTDENIDVIHDLSAATRDALLKHLDGCDTARAAEVRRVLHL
jgi:tetratricopeptide (TPR) repeat protein